MGWEEGRGGGGQRGQSCEPVGFSKLTCIWMAIYAPAGMKSVTHTDIKDPACASSFSPSCMQEIHS